MIGIPIEKFGTPYRIDRDKLENIEIDLSFLDEYLPSIYEDDFKSGLVMGLTSMIGFIKGRLNESQVKEILKEDIESACKNFERDNGKI